MGEPSSFKPLSDHGEATRLGDVKTFGLQAGQKAVVNRLRELAQDDPDAELLELWPVGTASGVSKSGSQLPYPAGKEAVYFAMRQGGRVRYGLAFLDNGSSVRSIRFRGSGAGIDLDFSTAARSFYPSLPTTTDEAGSMTLTREIWELAQMSPTDESRRPGDPTAFDAPPAPIGGSHMGKGPFGIVNRVILNPTTLGSREFSWYARSERACEELVSGGVTAKKLNQAIDRGTVAVVQYGRLLVRIVAVEKTSARVSIFPVGEGWVPLDLLSKD